MSNSGSLSRSSCLRDRSGESEKGSSLKIARDAIKNTELPCLRIRPLRSSLPSLADSSLELHPECLDEKIQCPGRGQGCHQLKDNCRAVRRRKVSRSPTRRWMLSSGNKTLFFSEELPEGQFEDEKNASAFFEFRQKSILYDGIRTMTGMQRSSNSDRNPSCMTEYR